MPQLDDMEADVRDRRDESDDAGSGCDEMIREVFDHLGRSFRDESPRDPDDDF
jgi:hypothetical protein